MAAGDFDHIFGPNPFPPDQAALHQAWITISRYGAQQDAKLTAAFLKEDPHTAATFVDFCADRFDIRAQWLMKLYVWDYQKAEEFEQKILPVLIESMLSLAKEK